MEVGCIKMINEFYCDKETQEQISHAFLGNNPNHVVLQSFLLEKKYKYFLKIEEDTKKERVKIPNRYSYALLKQDEVTLFFCSDEIKQIIKNVTRKNIKRIDVSIKEFSHRDYTVLHDEEVEGECLQFFFILSQKKIHEDAGGNIVCTLRGGEEGTLSFPPIANMFILLHTRTSDYVFHEYVNHLVRDSSIIVVHGICEL